MANNSFNLQADAKAPRKLLKHYVNVGMGGTQEWELLGRGVSDSSISLNPEKSEETDIYGITDSGVTAWKPTQNFEPFTIRGGSKLAFMLHEMWMNNTPELLSQFEILTVYGYVGSESAGFDADVQTNCTISPSSIGGSAYVDMPVEVTYSNAKTRGTVTMNAEHNPTFVPNSAA